MSGQILGLAVLISTCAAAATLRGTVVQQDGKPPAIRTAEGRLIAIEGERESLAVLGDARLVPYEIELNGRFETPQRFVVGPFIQTRSILVHKDGKTYTVSYWCPVCSIRSYTPGQCVCCHDETHLDLQELREIKGTDAFSRCARKSKIKGTDAFSRRARKSSDGKSRLSPPLPNGRGSVQRVTEPRP